jgi:hypothetical protein
LNGGSRKEEEEEGVVIAIRGGDNAAGVDGGSHRGVGVDAI